MNRPTLIFALAFAGGLPAVVADSLTGLITGVVVDEGGRPVSAGKVEFNRVDIGRIGKARPETPVAWPSRGSATIGPDGRFSIGRLGPEQYRLCATDTGPRLISDCVWGGVAAIEIQNGQAARDVTLRVVEARVIRVRVADPGRKVGQPTGIGRKEEKDRNTLGFGVRIGQLYRPLGQDRVTAPDMHSFSALVPKRYSGMLVADTNQKLKSASGDALPIRANDRRVLDFATSVAIELEVRIE